MDWTKNPLAAAYFAVEEPFSEKDKEETDFSCIYVYRALHKIKLGNTFDPFDITYVRRYIPKHWDPRIIVQGGLFTVHHTPYIPWNPPDIDKILIHYDIRKQIKKNLNRLGINAGLIYPDLDGVARYIKWLQSDKD